MAKMLTFRFLSLTAAVLVFLVGCQPTKDEARIGQTIAKAAGVEITIHELRHGLGSVKTTPESERRFLESMVDQTVIAKKAVEDGVDKEPNVVMALAAARRAILAQTYAEKTVGKTPQPTEVEMKQYYDNNPELFGKRRVYAFMDIGVPTNVASLEKIRAVLKDTKSLEQLRKQLGAQATDLPIRQRVNPAEELPPEVRKAFSALKVGGVGIVALPNQTQVLELKAVEEVPVPFNAAKGAVQRLMVDELRRDRLEKMVVGLRKDAKVEYFGTFAQPAVVKNP